MRKLPLCDFDREAVFLCKDRKTDDIFFSIASLKVDRWETEEKIIMNLSKITY